MALIPPFFLDCVVAIGFTDASGSPRYAATGFLYGKFLKQETPENKTYAVFLVTNKHVVEGVPTAYLRFNPEADEPAREYEINLTDSNGTKLWHEHTDPNIDVVAIRINGQLLIDQGIRFSFFRSDEHIAERARCIELGVTEGDSVFVLGFPMGIVGEQRNYVIVRQGAIARIRDALANTKSTFLVDSSIFPGNSGGPVVTRPEIVSIQGTKAVNSALLIGIVASYVPYQDVAISTQTKQPRVIFQENSGLASVFSIDYVVEIIEASMPVETQEQEKSIDVHPEENVVEEGNR